jgi:hypothetical protein
MLLFLRLLLLLLLPCSIRCTLLLLLPPVQHYAHC